MAVVSAQAAAMPNPFPFALNGVRHNDAVQAINQLTYAPLWNSAAMNPVSDTPNVRIDMQGVIGAGGGIVANGQNLQAQINGVGGHTSIACVHLAPNLAASAGSVPRQTEVLRKVKAAFFDSLNDFQNGNPHIYTVSGTFSS